jgi:hypothetical protein
LFRLFTQPHSLGVDLDDTGNWFLVLIKRVDRLKELAVEEVTETTVANDVMKDKYHLLSSKDNDLPPRVSRIESLVGPKPLIVKPFKDFWSRSGLVIVEKLDTGLQVNFV